MVRKDPPHHKIFFPPRTLLSFSRVVYLIITFVFLLQGGIGVTRVPQNAHHVRARRRCSAATDRQTQDLDSAGGTLVAWLVFFNVEAGYSVLFLQNKWRLPQIVKSRQEIFFLFSPSHRSKEGERERKRERERTGRGLRVQRGGGASRRAVGKEIGKVRVTCLPLPW